MAAVMGETGAGLVDETAITGGTALASKWDEVRKKCPWFFKLRDFHGERPNVSETDRANSTTELDLSAFEARTGSQPQPVLEENESALEEENNEDEENVETFEAEDEIPVDDEDQDRDWDELDAMGTTQPTSSDDDSEPEAPRVSVSRKAKVKATAEASKDRAKRPQVPEKRKLNTPSTVTAATPTTAPNKKNKRTPLSVSLAFKLI
jgi:hypothetical protein